MGIHANHPAVLQAEERGLILSPRKARGEGIEAGGSVWPLVVDVKCRVISEANWRGHWGARKKRVAVQRTAVRLALGHRLRRYDAATYRVTFTRLFVRGRGLDSDNLAGAFKACRDEVAAWVGLDDGDPRYTWVYEQAIHPTAGVRITIEGQP